jgi:hypothetical protein
MARGAVGHVLGNALSRRVDERRPVAGEQPAVGCEHGEQSDQLQLCYDSGSRDDLFAAADAMRAPRRI